MRDKENVTEAEREKKNDRQAERQRKRESDRQAEREKERSCSIRARRTIVMFVGKTFYRLMGGWQVT